MKQIIDLGNKPSLKQMVYQTLQMQIIRGDLKPGTRLTEEDLAQAMNISRAPIREALNMLERDGFTKIIPRKGALVAYATKKDAEDIWRCRIVLEPFAAKDALPNIPRDEIELALTHIKKLEDSYTFEEYTSSDLEVHNLYYHHIDNQYMASILDNLKAHSLRVRWLKEVRDKSTDQSRKSIAEHRSILEAFMAGDPNRVFDSVQFHIAKSAERLVGVFD